jgi:adenosylcobinamide-phosphate synthase
VNVTTPILITIALVLDAVLGEPRRWHPLVGFGRMALVLERWLHPGERASAWSGQLRGAIALLLAVVPAVALCWWLVHEPYGYVLDVLILYFVIAQRGLEEHAEQVLAALRTPDLEEARRRVGMMVSRETRDMDETRVAGATMESVLENGNDAVFGAIFWFAVLGAPGALAFRLVNTLDAMWGYRTERYLNFGRVAARLDDVLNFIPARLTAFAYALCGDTMVALRSWRTQARTWESPNAGPVMAAGAGALRVQLGGGAFYHGAWKERPPLGAGKAPDVGGIERALKLLRHTTLLWIAVIWSIGAALWVRGHA